MVLSVADIDDPVPRAVAVTTPSNADYNYHAACQASYSGQDSDNSHGHGWSTALDISAAEDTTKPVLKLIGSDIITSGMTEKDPVTDARLDWGVFALAPCVTEAVGALSNVSPFPNPPVIPT